MAVQESINKFIKQCKRVLRVAKKPNSEEYVNFSKVTGAGILLIGAVGFIIVLIGQLVNL